MFIHLLFMLYTGLIFVRVAVSWFPEMQKYRVIEWVASITDPFLNLFRRFIPPIGGIIDLSPLIALIVLQILERIILNILWR